MSEENSLVTTNEQTALSTGACISMEEILKDAAGLQIQFNKIKTPAGGSIVFEVEDINTGSPEPMKTLSAIILKSLPSNVMYEDSYDGENNPPDCSSLDGVVGMTNEGVERECATCPFNQFGSGENGLGKKCKNRRTLYVLLDGEELPRMISLPSTSLAALSKFQTNLLMARQRLRDVRCVIGLQKASSKTNIAYSSYTFAKGAVVINDEDIIRVNNALALLCAAGIE